MVVFALAKQSRKTRLSGVDKQEYSVKYYQTHKDIIRQRAKQWKHDNRDYLNELRRSANTIPCPCGGSYKFHHKYDHKKCKRHQQYEYRQSNMVKIDKTPIVLRFMN